MPHNWKRGGITILIGTGSRHLVPKRVVAGIRLPDDPPMPTLWVGIGFSGTCDDQGALLEATAFAGKRSLRLTAVLKLMRRA